MFTLHSSSATATIIIAAIILSVSAQPPAPSPFSGTESPTSPVPFSPAPTTGVESPTSPEPFAPAPTTGTNDCLMPLSNMTDCLSYVQMPSNATVPDKNCCPELAGLIDSNPICLCELLSNSSLTESFGIKIDVSRALKLPSICRIQTPPVSLCSDAGYPVPGPIASDAPQSVSPGVQPPQGLPSSPSAGNNNDASKIGSSAQALFIGLAFSFLLTFL